VAPPMTRRLPDHFVLAGHTRSTAGLLRRRLEKDVPTRAVTRSATATEKGPLPAGNFWPGIVAARSLAQPRSMRPGSGSGTVLATLTYRSQTQPPPPLGPPASKSAQRPSLARSDETFAGAVRSNPCKAATQSAPPCIGVGYSQQCAKVKQFVRRQPARDAQHLRRCCRQERENTAFFGSETTLEPSTPSSTEHLADSGHEKASAPRTGSGAWTATVFVRSTSWR
jgi:hypothetical protein